MAEVTSGEAMGVSLFSFTKVTCIQCTYIWKQQKYSEWAYMLL